MSNGVWFVLLATAYIVIMGLVLRRRRGRIGPAAAGAIDELLHQDRKRAIEILVEEKAAARDPETADGIPDPKPQDPVSQIPNPKHRG